MSSWWSALNPFAEVQAEEAKDDDKKDDKEEEESTNPNSPLISLNSIDVCR